MASQIPDRLYFKIGEVSKITKVEPYVLRYWESRFKMINPQKSKSKQRIYRRRDVETILEIKRLLYQEGYTLEGARKRLSALQGEQKDKQLKLELGGDRGKYIKELKSIKEELYSIKKILEMGE
ncbi:MAG: MerR family transcriptional regulator [Deltaproteobacteria bacterium]|nr:MerR family transcriptional regulator [Deltaproteobacteria bacterium]